jgi:outer membrane protein assembly factor BamB
MKRSLSLALLCIAAVTVSACRQVPSPISPAPDPSTPGRAPAPAAGGAAPKAGDWSNWRGPEQTGVSRERGLPDSFSADPAAKDSNVLWRVPYGGISTPVVQNGRVYVINKVGEDVTQQERVMCVEADTGKVLWEHKFNVFLTDIVSDRLGWTQLCGDPETGNVYAQGTQGFLMCFDKDGKILWQHSLTEEYGRVSGYGGRVTSPLVDEDLVIVSMANASWGEQTVGGIRLVAFDKKTGAVRWWGWTGFRVYNSYYSCPTVAVINGERLIITGGGDGGVHAFKVHTGEKVWSYLMCEEMVNCTPVVDGNYVYCGHGEENKDGTQGAVVCLDAGNVTKGEPAVVWEKHGIKAKYGSPAIHDGRLYIPDVAGWLYCFDAKHGKRLWKFQYGNNTKGSPVWADGKIYITDVDGGFSILEPGDKKCAEKKKVSFPAVKGVPVGLSGSPAIANGRIYFMTTADLYCIRPKSGSSTADAVPAKPKETAPAAGAAAVHLQVAPADITLLPGEKAEFKARAFDEHGQLLGEVEAEWKLDGTLPFQFPVNWPPPIPPVGVPGPPLKGELSTQSGTKTTLIVAEKPPGQFGRLVAKYKGLTNYARVRVAAVAPYEPKFADIPVGRSPGGWVNTMGKFSIAELGGKKVLKKRDDAASPLVATAHAYIGLPTEKDYMIEVDAMGTKVGPDLPEAGILVQRYTLVLVGNTQQLRLISWDALPRIDKSIAFPWKEDVWYSLKLKVDVDGDKAMVRGKVWERGKPEPKAWTVEVEDPIPNREGAPGIFGKAVGVVGPKKPGATVYFDNLKITKK